MLSKTIAMCDKLNGDRKIFILYQIQNTFPDCQNVKKILKNSYAAKKVLTA